MGLMQKIKNFYWYKLCKKDPYDMAIENYRREGIKIGERCHIYSPIGGGVDSFLLEIGDDVTIAGGCILLRHDNGIVKASHGEYTDIIGKIVIGNNCFIGYNSIILPGVELADNTLVGAGSVVTKSVKTPGMILAGNPARIVGKMETYLEKNKPYAVNLSGLSWDEKKQVIADHVAKVQRPYMDE